MRSWWPRLLAAVRDLSPGYLALVMATGIVSKAVHLDGAVSLGGFLLGVGIVAYILLVAGYGWRIAAYRRRFLADVRDPGRAFAFFTFVAASDVLAALLAGDGHTAAAVALLALGGAGWLLLCYGLPLLIRRSGPRPVLAEANGTWFDLAVGTQSIAVAATSLRPVHRAVAALAVVCWAIGVVLYLVIAGLLVSALLQYPVRPAELTAPYWIFMGATAITALAGAQILRLPADALVAAVRQVVSGVSVLLWAFGTWLVPLLLAAGGWRHLHHRVPLRYEPGLWSIVFPVGMYGVASHELGMAIGVSWLVTLGRYEAWLALAVWAIVAAAMAGTLLVRWPSAVRPDGRE